MKVYLIYTGNDGDSGRLICICKSRAKCFQVIGKLNKDFSFENDGADLTRSLQTCFDKGSNRSIWARIDEIEVIE